ncbi:BMP family ABC transporter substrate-binding protein [Brevibacillus sp. TJ4]|uniref:BMP family ABC transporter substrate-binding protein n=1 Tax=Brevibacillus sp. TJ4 TaxID=3234853 RepID=UPI0037D9703B
MFKLQLFPALFTCLVIGMLVLISNQYLTSLQHVRDFQEKGQSLYKQRVALLLEGPTYDQGWNITALESLIALQQEHNFSLEIASNLKPEEITTVARTYASNGYDLLLGHGVIFSEPFTQVSPYYPETRFVSFNGEAHHPNQTTIRYDMKPAGYLVGLLAARMSKTGKVGYIAVDKPPEIDQIEGFLQGVMVHSPTTQVSVGYVPDFNDVPSALTVTKEMIASDIDVIYTTGDSFNLEVITEAQRSKVYTIGYIADQRYIAPDYVLASLIQDVDQCYRTIMEQFLQGNLPTGTVMYGLSEGVNYFSPFGPMVPQEIRDEIRQELQRLIQQPDLHGGK